MKIKILGTGHGTATECYNTCFAMEKENKYFLVDTGGGNGILKQFKETNIDVKDIKSMFISHTHTDHIVGSVWVLRMVIRQYLISDFNEEFYVYGNNEVINAVRQMCNVVLPPKFCAVIDDKVKLVEVDDNSEVMILGNKVEFFDINAKKVKQTGFNMYMENGDKFTFIGDETCDVNTEKYVQDSTWLFADAYMAGQEAEEYNPIQRHHHSTVKFVAELCERLNVKNVIMSHTIDTDLANRKKTFTEDAKKYYHGNVFVPDDLEILEI